MESSSHNGTRVFPPLADTRGFLWPPSEEEVRLAWFLDGALPSGWEIYRRPFLNGDYPAVAVLHPEVGLGIIDVYPADASTLRKTGPHSGSPYERDDIKVRSPASLTRRYIENLTDLYAPEIGADLKEDRMGRGALFVALYVPGLSTANARDRIPVQPGTCVVFGDDALDLPSDPSGSPGHTAAVSRIVPSVDGSNAEHFRPAWVPQIRNALRPPTHEPEHGEPLRLSERQERYAEPSPGTRQRVRGVAGCGKTLVLAQRAARLASKGRRVLVVHFNVTLANYIRYHIDRAPLSFDPALITVIHFHGWCGRVFELMDAHWPSGVEVNASESLARLQRQAAQKGIQTPVDADVDALCKLLGTTVSNVRTGIVMEERVPQAVSRFLRDPRVSKRERYDAVLIDEGQDFCHAWYETLLGALNEGGEVMMVSDLRQNIYEQQADWTEDTERGGGGAFDGPWGRLNRTYRLPGPAAATATAFADTFMPDLPQACRLPQRPAPAQASLESDPAFAALGPSVTWANYERGDADVSPAVVRVVQTILAHVASSAVRPQDLAVLVLNHGVGDEVSEGLAEVGVPVNRVGAGKASKEGFVMDDGRVKVSTIHSFKGWELQNIVVLLTEDDAPKGRTNASLDRLVYTALTRTRRHVVVLNELGRYWTFGEQLLPSGAAPNRWWSP